MADLHRRRFLRDATIATVGSGAALVGCTTPAARPDALARYDATTFTFGGATRPVFSRGTGRTVIVMHELPGLTRETVEWADWLVDRGGFHVVLPLLFGDPLEPAPSDALQTVALCVRHEFNCLRDHRPSPITDWLRALASDVNARDGGRGIGLVGMCFTGGFVLTMMLDDAVIAPVCAQPALPLKPDDGLDISVENLRRAKAVVVDKPLLALRFKKDWICPAARFRRLHDEFGDHVDLVEVPGRNHATLTYDYRKALDAGVDTRERVLRHLTKKLHRVVP